jgi:hypothetical protein
VYESSFPPVGAADLKGGKLLGEGGFKLETC